MGLKSWLLGKAATHEVEEARKGNRGAQMKKVLVFLDGKKRVLAILSYLIAGAVSAAGLGDHTPVIGFLFYALKWDPTGMGIDVGVIAQNGFAIWAAIDGTIKLLKSKNQPPAVSPETLAKLQ